MANSLLVVSVMMVIVGVTEGERRGQCQEITIPMCKGIAYNYTYMPNEVSLWSSSSSTLPT